MNYQQQLIDLAPEKEYFVGIDSDGCAFDTMEIKHKECFCPAFIQHMGLQRVSKYAREVWDFVNLYSQSRGLNRFLALQEALEWVLQRPEVKARGLELPDMAALKEWTAKETRLGQPALEAYLRDHSDTLLEAALDWSKALNKAIGEMVHGIVPFPGVRESLQKLQERADITVVSQTPLEALEREWKEHRIDVFLRLIAGQEHGTKSEHLQLAAGKKYQSDHSLMIGDAPGDLKAAEDNGMLFYPIIPGREEESWKRFYEEAANRFFDGTYKGEYQKKCIREFQAGLPERPPWY